MMVYNKSKKFIKFRVGDKIISKQLSQIKIGMTAGTSLHSRHNIKDIMVIFYNRNNPIRSLNKKAVKFDRKLGLCFRNMPTT